MLQNGIDDVIQSQNFMLPYGGLIKNLVLDRWYPFFVGDQKMLVFLLLFLFATFISMFVPKEMNEKKEKKDTNSSPFLIKEDSSSAIELLSRFLSVLGSNAFVVMMGYGIYKIFISLYNVENKQTNPYTLKYIHYLSGKITHFLYQGNFLKLGYCLLGFILFIDILYILTNKVALKFGFFIRSLFILGLIAGIFYTWTLMNSVQYQQETKWEKEKLQPYLTSLPLEKQTTVVTKAIAYSDDDQNTYVKFQYKDENGHTVTFAGKAPNAKMHNATGNVTYITYKILPKTINKDYAKGIIEMNLYVSQNNVNNVKIYRE